MTPEEAIFLDARSFVLRMSRVMCRVEAADRDQAFRDAITVVLQLSAHVVPDGERVVKDAAEAFAKKVTDASES